MIVSKFVLISLLFLLYDKRSHAAAITASSNDAVSLIFPLLPPRCHLEGPYSHQGEGNDDNLSERSYLSSKYPSTCAVSEDKCSRYVIDGHFPVSDIEQLHAVAQKGMSQRESTGGPTILDINTGYLRDSNGLVNIFTSPTDVFSSEDFAHYGRIINKLKELVSSTFDISDLYFTAPTFITRLDGRADWKPQGIHDEYWHPHADMNNTGHYHYSGLLYMSTYRKDFDGGRVIFTSSTHYDQEDERDYELIVEPKAGRVIMFTSGAENTHFVERVTNGQRFVLSFWFTCDPSRQFEIFLDGKKHTLFSHGVREKIQANQSAKQTGKQKQPRKEL